MTIKLIETLENAIKSVAQEFPKDASVMVQFAAGDWAAIKLALGEARQKWDDLTKHNVADAAGVVSHTSGGQPIAADERLDMAVAAMPEPAEAPPEAPVDASTPTEGVVEPAPVTTEGAAT